MCILPKSRGFVFEISWWTEVYKDWFTAGLCSVAIRHEQLAKYYNEYATKIVPIQTVTLRDSSAPPIFQRCIKSIFVGVPSMLVQVDDILITGEDDSSHINSVEEVLRRLAEAGLQAKRSKCRLRDDSAYNGRQVDNIGVWPKL